MSAQPAEARPGAAVTLTALLVEPAGPVSAPAPGWAFCVARRPAADDNTVSASCYGAASPDLRPFTSGVDPLVAAAVLPSQGCAVFGSEPPPAAPGEPPLRPADPDPTGGYYQPVRVAWPGEGPVAFGQVRLACALPQAPAAVAQEFRARYRPNQNPTLADFRLADGAGDVAAGQRTQVVLTWPDADAEDYVAYDLASSALQDRTESLSVAWFTTGGTLDADTTAASGAGAEVGWTAPESAGTAHLWAVLRDDRGGMAWRHLAIEVR